MKDGYRFRGTEILRECSVPIRLLAHRFVSDYAFGQKKFWSAESRHRGSHCFPSEKWGAIQTVEWESDSYSGEEIEGLTATAFGRDFDLVRLNISFRKNCDFKRQWALLMLDSAQSVCRSRELKI